MASLYKIDERLEALITEQFDIEDGVIYETEEELAKKIDEVSLDLNTKIENIGCFIKNLEAENEALEKEKKNLEKRKAVNEKKIEGLKNYLNGYLTATIADDNKRAKWRFKTAKVVLGYRRSSKVEVPDIEQLDKKYINKSQSDIFNVKTEISADKKAIGEAIKNGKEVKGAFLKDNINLSVK